MKRKIHKTIFSLMLLTAILTTPIFADTTQWSKEKANDWQKQHGWLIGCNFGPSTAINQLEMFQAETFDTKTIDRELGWAQDLGFNTIRVYLHNLLWDQDSKGFINRLEKFLEIADKHDIKVMFVIFDSVWDPFPKLGKQRDPKPHVHNSGWMQSPGVEILSDPSRHDELKGYVKGIIGHFKNDTRVLAWDIFNEPDNNNTPAYVMHEPENKAELALILLKKAFKWAKEADPSQPVTSAPWKDDWSSDENLSAQDKFLFTNSDIITYHCYDDINSMKTRVEQIKRFGRPMLCTEYMARPTGSTFKNILPYLKSQNVGAYNWGFVAGKTQTIYPWDSWKRPYVAEPPVWFHDIFRTDGSPYIQAEVNLIKTLTGKK